jgi:hypothetical protein
VHSGGGSGGGGGWFGFGARHGASQAGSADASAAGAAAAESVMKIGGEPAGRRPEQVGRRPEQAGRRPEQSGQLRRPSSDPTSSVGHRAERRGERRPSSESTSSGGQGGWFGLGARDGAWADGAAAEDAVTGAQKSDSTSSGGWFGQLDAQLNHGGWLGFNVHTGRSGVTTEATSAAGLFVSLPPALASTPAPGPWRWPWEQPLAAPVGAAETIPTHSSGVTNRCLCCVTCDW